MPPILILVRHAQGLHNVDNKYPKHECLQNYTIPDPVISEKGVEQCKLLQQHLMKNEPLAKDIGMIVSSPMRRTLQTAHLTFGWLVEHGIKIVPDALWQETSDKPCDTGSPLLQLQPQFPTIDLSGVDPMFPEKTGTYAFTKAATLERGQMALLSLYERPEKVIVVVSHAGFLGTAVTQRHFMNADYRIFDFEPPTDGTLKLKERKETQGSKTDELSGGMKSSFNGIRELSEADFPL